MAPRRPDLLRLMERRWQGSPDPGLPDDAVASVCETLSAHVQTLQHQAQDLQHRLDKAKCRGSAAFARASGVMALLEVDRWRRADLATALAAKFWHSEAKRLEDAAQHFVDNGTQALQDPRAFAAQETGRRTLEQAKSLRSCLAQRVAQAEARRLETQKWRTREHEAMAEQLAMHLPGFVAGAGHAALSSHLGRRIKRWAHEQTPGGLTPSDVLQLGLAALANVANGDADRARRILQSLETRALADWVPHPDAVRQDHDSSVTHDVCALCRKMSQIPRGMEVLSRLAAGERARAPARRVLTAYWRAEQAHRESTDHRVQDWLMGAMNAAQQMLLAGSLQSTPAPYRAAYAAVCSGMLSNGPGSRYAQLNALLEQVVTVWTDRATQDPAGSWQWLPKALASEPVTPFKAETLGLAALAARRSGLMTGGTDARQQVRDVAAQLHALIPLQTAASSSAPEAVREQTLALTVVLSHLQSTTDTEDAQGPLTSAHLDALATDLARRLAPDLAAASTTSSPALHRLVRVGDTPVQVLMRVLQCWPQSTLASAPLAAIGPAVQAARESEASAAVTRIGHAADLARWMAPVIKHLVPRDTLKLSGGNRTGMALRSVALPMPLSLIQPFNLLWSVGYHDEAESSFKVRRDERGIAFSIGAGRASTSDARIGIEVRAGAFNLMGASVAVELKAQHGQKEGESVILCVPGQPGDDVALQNEAKALLRSLTVWRDRPQGEASEDLLGHVLGRHPALEVVDEGPAVHAYLGGQLRVAAGAVLGSSYTPGGSIYGLGPQAEGAYSIVHRQGVQNAAEGATHGLSGRSSSWAQGLHFLAELCAPDLPRASHQKIDLQRTQDALIVTSRCDRLEVEARRSELGTVDMLAEIEHQREAWLSGAVRQQEARQQWDQFTTQVQRLHEDGGNSGVSYRCSISRRLAHEARTSIEVLEGLAAFAAEKDDAVELAGIHAARDHLLADPSSWLPDRLTVMAYGKAIETTGLRAGLVSQRVSGARASHMVAQFPPV